MKQPTPFTAPQGAALVGAALLLLLLGIWIFSWFLPWPAFWAALILALWPKMGRFNAKSGEPQGSWFSNNFVFLHYCPILLIPHYVQHQFLAPVIQCIWYILAACLQPALRLGMVGSTRFKTPQGPVRLFYFGDNVYSGMRCAAYDNDSFLASYTDEYDCLLTRITVSHLYQWKIRTIRPGTFVFGRCKIHRFRYKDDFHFIDKLCEEVGFDLTALRFDLPTSRWRGAICELLRDALPAGTSFPYHFLQRTGWKEPDAWVAARDRGLLASAPPGSTLEPLARQYLSNPNSATSGDQARADLFTAINPYLEPSQEG